MRKIGIIMCTLIVLLVGFGVFVVPRLVDAEWLRTQVEAALSDATGRSVRLGSIDFSWSGGLVIDEIEILDPRGSTWSEGPFLQAQSLGLRVGLAELLSRRLDIRDLYLGAPRIVIVRSADGALSISDLLDREDDGSGTDATGPADPETSSAPDASPASDAPSSDDGRDPGASRGGSSLDAVSAKVRLEGGSLLFVDEKLSARWELTELDGVARLEGSALAIVLDGALNRGPIRIEAEADLATGSYRLKRATVDQAELGAQFAQLAYLVPLFGEQPNAVDGKMDLVLSEVKAKGRDAAALSASLSGEGELRFADGRLESKPLEEIVTALEAFGVDTGVGDPGAPGIQVTLLTSTFRMADGRVLSDTTLDADGLDLEMAGSTGLDGTMDHRVVVLELNRVLEKNPNLKKYITDAGQLPVTIKGTVNNPKIGIDAAGAVTEAVVEQLDDLISDGLDSLFGKKKKKPEEPAPSAEPPAAP